MPDLNAEHWDNYWQGRASQLSGSALVEVGIENNHSLNKFWEKIFSKLDPSTKIIDFACGAGSVLDHAYKLGNSNLTGVDISQKALDVMVSKIPPALGICAPVDTLPTEGKSFDLVTSQFGIEYAGDRENLCKAFLEMERILHFGGEITIVAHAKNGLIYDGCMNSLKHIELIADSEFLDVSEKVISMLHDDPNNENLQRLMGRLNQTAEPIMSWLRSADHSKNEFAAFTYSMLKSSHKLITNHQNYTKEDSLKWVTKNHFELEAYKGRMKSMTEAALSERDIFELKRALTKNQSQLHFRQAEKLYFPPNKKQAAWVIRAKK